MARAADGILTDDSPVTFDCKCCGSCCAGGLEVFLNTADVWNLRSYFKTPTGALIDKFLSLELRAEYGSYPLCLIRMRGGACPFLERRLCSAHPARPASCRLFPVIHYHDHEAGQLFAFASGMDFCPGGSDACSRPLRDWLALNSFSDYLKAVEFQRRLAPLARVRVSGDVSDAIFRALFDFDSEPDFPFAGIYDAGPCALEGVMRWAEKKLDAILESVEPWRGGAGG